MSRPWVAVEVRVEPTEVDVVSGLLWAAGVAGVEERPAGSSVALVASVAPGVDLDSLLVALEPWSPVRSAVDPATGLDAWRDHARPVRVGPVELRPAWLEADPGGSAPVVAELDAGHSFGSGSHPTTTLALAALVDHLEPGATLLDVGCGSGVLAVAAVLVGASRAMAVDIEPAAVEVTTANAARNGVADRVVASTTPVGELVGTFDVVVANIVAPVLVELAPVLSRLVATPGSLVLSGVLVERADAVRAAFGSLVEVERREADGWCALVLASAGQPGLDQADGVAEAARPTHRQ